MCYVGLKIKPTKNGWATVGPRAGSGPQKRNDGPPKVF